MAITARFLTGVSYDDPDITEVLHSLHGASFVIPDYPTVYPYNNLHVYTIGVGDASVRLSVGMAIVGGYFYENTEPLSLTLDAQGGGLNRIDRIVLRYSDISQQARAVVVKGTAGATPAFPAIYDEDVPLAWVWVPNGFTAASAVAAANIHDARTFNLPAHYMDSESPENILPNSEWLAWSSSTTNNSPDYWADNISVGTMVPAAILGDAPRGQAAQVTLANNEYFECNMLAPDGNAENWALSTLTLWGNLNITSGGPLTVRLLSYPGPVVLSTQNYYQASSFYEFLQRCRIDYVTSPAVAGLTLQYINTSGGNITFKCDPPILTKGLLPGPPRMRHEILYLSKGTPVSDASWNYTAKSTGTNQANLTTGWGSKIPPGIRGVLVDMLARDSGSGGASVPCGLRLFSYYPNATGSGGIIELATAGNDKYRGEMGVVGVDIATHSFTIQVWATGASTLDAAVYITGLLT